MTDRATLEALLARVLEGSGPDRELDADIALAFGIVSSRVGNCFYGHKHYSVMVLDRDYYDHDGNAPELPPFTGSLDAVLRDLLPEGWSWYVAMRHYLAPVGASGSVWQAGQQRATFTADAATLQRALIAACIKARMEAQGE